MPPPPHPRPPRRSVDESDSLNQRDPPQRGRRLMDLTAMETDDKGPICLAPAEADDQVVPDAAAAAEEALSLEDELRFVKRTDEAAADADGEQRDSYIVAAE